MSKTLVYAVGLGLLSWLGLPKIFGAESQYRWQRSADSIALARNGHVVWQFNQGTHGATKPFFHPVALPGGSPLTWQSPPDHVWHYALWFSWKYLNGVNYWEQDRNGNCEGITEWGAASFEPQSDYSGLLRLDLRYRPRKSDRPILTEKRTIVISAPAADGSYAMDWTCEFKAGDEPVKLDRTPPGNQPGGYAGLSVRLAKGLGDVQVEATADKGEARGNRYGYAAMATDFNGRIDDGEAGIAILDHPSNPRSPSRWYVIKDPGQPFWYMNAAWLQLEPYVLAAKASFTLRYRVCIHPARWDGARLKAESERYLRATPGS